LEVFNIDESGDYELVTSAKVLSDLLENNEDVYVILTHDWRICWIWLGKNCNIRKKFSGARTARSILGERKLAYSVKTVDSGDEPKIFKEIIDTPLSKTYKTEAASLKHVKIQKMILNQDLPSDDYKREAVLIGDKFYVAVEVKVMGNTTHKYEPSEFLPEGMSELPDNYVGRLFVKHGRVQALEFLTKNRISKKTKKEITKTVRKKGKIKERRKLENKSQITDNQKVETQKKEIIEEKVQVSNEDDTESSEILPEPELKSLRRTEYIKKKQRKKGKPKRKHY